MLGCLLSLHLSIERMLHCNSVITDSDTAERRLIHRPSVDHSTLSCILVCECSMCLWSLICLNGRRHWTQQFNKLRKPSTYVQVISPRQCLSSYESICLLANISQCLYHHGNRAVKAIDSEVYREENGNFWLQWNIYQLTISDSWFLLFSVKR